MLDLLNYMYIYIYMCICWCVQLNKLRNARYNDKDKYILLSERNGRLCFLAQCDSYQCSGGTTGHHLLSWASKFFRNITLYRTILCHDRIDIT